MGKRAGVTSALVLVLALCAAQATAAAQTPAMSQQRASVAGTIAAVDAKHNLMTLRTGWLFKRQFTVAHEADITDGERRLELENLQPGQQVELEYTTDAQGTPVAHLIKLKSPADGSAE